MSLKKKPAVVTFAELCRQNTAPVLRPDSNWVKEDGPLLAKGNVLKALTHPGAPFGSFADRADTDADHNILKVTTAGTYLGKYGTLVIKANGTYTYTLYSNADKPAAFAKVQGLSEGETLVESFKYKATDGFVTKGSTLKITIFGTDDPVTITNLTPKAKGGDTIVDEDGLPGAILDSSPLGSGETDGQEHAANTGDFKISAPDGLKTLTVGGVTVIANGVFIPGVIISTPLGNTLKINSFNPSTGVVTYAYTLNAAVDHPGAGEDTIFESFQVKLTDVDGSSATASLDVAIVDDQPSIEVCQHYTEEVARLNVVVDECIPPSALSVDETDLGTDATSNFAGIFDGNFGADGPGSITFAVDTSGGPSGLIDTLSGSVVVVAKEGNDIVGRIGPDPADVVFVISIDAVTGTVTFDQQRAVVHDPNFGPNDFEFMPFDLVKVVATITDADGDTDSATFNAGNLFGIFDVAPTAQDEPAQSVAEGATITGVFDFVPGSDGATVTAINGTPLVFGADGFSQIVDLGLGSIKVKADGTYEFTADNPTNNPAKITGTFTVTDGDGDPDDGTFEFNITDVNEPSGGGATAAVDDDGLPGSNPLSTVGDLDANAGDDPADISEATFTGTLGGSVGLDVPGTFSFAPALNGASIAVGLETATLAVAGNILTATGPRGPLFQVEITDPATGAYKVKLLDNVLHEGGPNYEEVNAVVDLGYVITDSDGSTAPGTLTVVFDDDAPTVALNFSMYGDTVLDETATTSTAPTISIGAFVAGDDPDVGGTGVIATANSIGPVVVPTIAFGADGAAAASSVAYSLSVGAVPSGLAVTDGSLIELVQVSSTVVVGKVVGGAFDGQAAFAVEIDPAGGSLKVEQYLSLDHPLNPDPNDVLDIADFALFAVVTVTDGDNDVATAGYTIGDKIRFFDDAATAQDEPAQAVAEGATITGTFDFAPGSDGATVTAINGTLLVFGADGFSQLVDLGLGTIKVKADGTYEFTADNPANSPASVTGTFTVTDGDGDPDDGAFEFNITDVNEPSGGSATATVDDDGLPGNNPFSTIGDLDANAGDDPADVSEATFTGTLGGSVGLDVPGTFSFAPALNGASVTVGLETATLAVAGNILTATGPRGALFQVEITNPATGAYKVTLLDNVLHEGGPNNEEVNAVVDLGYVITDSDGSTAPGTLTVVFDDDAPSAGSVVDSTFVLLDDDDVPGAGGNPGNGESFGDAVVSSLTTFIGASAGADGLKSFGVTGPATLGTEAASSTYDAGTGLLVISTARGPILQASVTYNGFFVGVTSLTLLKPILHATGNGENDAPVTITYTLTDNDDDTATGSYTFVVDDDTPIGNEITATTVLDDDVQTVFAGNSGGAGDVADAASTSGGPGTLFSAGADGLKSLAFTAPTITTIYKDAGGIAQQEAVTFTTTTVAGVTTYTGSSAHNPKVIELVANANGSYTVTQYAPIAHPTSSTTEETSDIVFNFTVTDNDDDTATGSLTVKVNDDTPDVIVSLNPDGQVHLDETATSSLAATLGVANIGDDPDVGGSGAIAAATSATSAATATALFGADGPAAGTQPAFALDVTLANSGLQVTDGSAITLVEEGALVVGRVVSGTFSGQAAFAIAIDAVTGKVTVEQYLSLKHLDPSNPNDGAFLATGTLAVTATVTDGDGDSVTKSADISSQISFSDDGPSSGVNATVLLDDDALANGNALGTGDDADAANVSGTLAHAFGADGAGSISFLTTGNPTGFTYVPNGTGLLVKQGSVTVLTITLDASTGAYSVTQNAPILHLAGSNENNQIFTLNYTVTDGDGDSVPGTLTINVDDDTAIAVNDTDVIPSGSVLPAVGNVITDAEGDGGADSVGADGGAAIIAIAGFGGAGAVGGLTAGQYGQLTINSDGGYSYTRNPGTPGGVTDTFTYTLTDGDGDTTTATLSITINNSVPVTGTNATVQLDDDALAGGNAGGTGDDANALNTTGTLSASGGDGALTFAFGTITLPPALSFTVDSPNATTRLVKQSGITVLTITLDTATGGYTVTQNAPISHPSGGNENNLDFTVGYTVTDADGESANGTLAINVDDDTAVANVVVNPNLTDDEGKGPYAANSIEGQTTPLGTDADVAGSPAAVTGGAGTLFSIGADGLGSIAVTGPAGVLAIYKLASGLPAQEVVAYTSVTDGSGNVTLTGKGAVSGNTAFTLTVNANGSYAFTQNAALVHPLFDPSNEDDLPLTFNFTVTDKDGDPASGSLTVTVDDDTPVGGAVTKTINESADVDTNVSLILDVSGSMGDASGLTGLSRLDVLKASVAELLEQYDALGNVAVRIVTFDTNAAAIGSVWMSVADAKAAVQALVPLNSTNYDEALTDIMAAFGSAGKITGAQNVAYFISDGQPNQPSGSAGIDATEQAAWESFLDTNNIVAHALGAGSGVTVSALDPIAFNGVTGNQIAPLVVTDLGQLTATLVATVTGATTSGNLLTEGAGNFGADGGYLSSVAIGGQTFAYDPVTDAITASGAGTATFTFNATTNVLTIATAIGGQLAVDLDNGAYTYTGPASVPSNQSDVFTYTLKDGDGDTASATFTVNILNEDRAPIVRDDAIITNIGGSGAAIVIPTFALTYNDSDPDGQAITVTAAGSVADGISAVLGAGIVTFNDNDTDGGAFAYTGSTTAPAGSDTATVTVTRVSATTDPLNGNGLANILIDNDSTNTLNGFEGNDVLIGNGGNDILVGGAGADVMQGGAGDDIFDFNAVSESPTLALADTILDFNTASAGEKIDLAGIFGGTLGFQVAQSTATVANTVTWSQDAGTNTTIVRADVNGNTTADFVIKLSGLLTLTAGDFAL